MNTLKRRDMKSPAEVCRREGFVLGFVMAIVLAVSILGLALMSAASMSALETSRYLNTVKAFWLAEAGVQQFSKRAFSNNYSSIASASLGDGTVQVIVSNNPPSPVQPYADCVGTVQGAVQKVRVDFQYLSDFYRYGIAAGGGAGSNWTLTLRGSGNVIRTNFGTGSNPDWHYIRGRDAVMGNVYANGDVRLYENSIVSNAIAPNVYTVRGDVESTRSVSTTGTARITGILSNNVSQKIAPDIAGMDYANNNTWDVAAEYQKNGLTTGRLPTGHPLRNLVIMNPTSGSDNRSDECNSTPGEDDFFFEPSSFPQGAGTPSNAVTPLALDGGGPNGTTYYVNGHVWFNSGNTYGFKVSGKATIASSMDIHVSDNLKYDNTNSLLGLVAAGAYDNSGNRVSGGNVYFGDPQYGTMYTVDAFMFAANDFLFNTFAAGASAGEQREPDSGFEVYGNFAALNQVKVYRDWYTATNGSWRSAWWDPSANAWRDVVASNLLTTTGSNSETNRLRHYQMTLKYDDRIRDQRTQPPRLPRQSQFGGGYGGITRWRQVY